LAGMERDDVVRFEGVVKRYGDLVAVDGVDLSVPAGTCFGLIGPNGAGKTTLLKMLVGLSPISEGQIQVFGLDVARHRRQVNQRLGVVPQEGSLDTSLTAFDNLVLFAGYFGIPRRLARRRAEDLLGFVQLRDRRDAVLSELSGGMVRRLVLARALMNQPDLLVLDEPTTGLDPQARHLLWDRVRTLRAEGRSVLLTTHYMDEAQRLCDTIAVIDHGRILAVDTPANLIAQTVGEEVVEVETSGDPEVLAGARELLAASLEVEVHGPFVHGYGSDGEAAGALLGRPGVLSVTRRRANLEDVFLRLAGRELRK